MGTRHNKDDSASQRRTSDLSAADKKEIGRWGECRVIDELRKEYSEKYSGEIRPIREWSFSIVSAGNEVVRVRWLNEDGEVGVGHDIEVVEEGQPTTYIEVKSTITPDNEWFKVRRPQWRFARDHGNAFFIYCVHNAGTNNATITKIQNPYECWRRGGLEGYPIEIRLWMASR